MVDVFDDSDFNITSELFTTQKEVDPCKNKCSMLNPSHVAIYVYQFYHTIVWRACLRADTAQPHNSSALIFHHKLVTTKVNT